MARIDASIGQFATGPSLFQILRDIDGNEIDLDGCTVSFAMLPRDRSTDTPIIGHVVVHLDVLGKVEQVWQSGDSDLDGFWDYEWIVYDAGGHRISVPAAEGHPYFTLLIVKSLVPKAFVPPTNPPPTVPKVGTFNTVNTLADLLALPTTGLMPGRTIIIVRQINKGFRLDGAAGAVDPSIGQYATADDPTVQWFLFT